MHAFLVRIRNNDLTPCKGVSIIDMGAKMGQNGVDNGKLIFRNMRIGRTSLLNSVADVSEDGIHICRIASKRGRFLVALNQLMSGRLCLASKGVGRTKQALAIAVRYSMTRLAVGKDGESSARIWDFQLQQNAIVPLLARTYVVSGFGMNFIKKRYEKETTRNGKGTADMSMELQVLCSGIKAMVTWHCEKTVSVCRERCGGAGYLGVNKFGEMLKDAHAITTAEGDNRVLFQKVAKEVLAWHRESKLATVSKDVRVASFDSIDDLEYLLHRRLTVVVAELEAALDLHKSQGGDRYDAWMFALSDKIQRLATSYMEWIVLHHMHPDDSILNQLARLYAVDCIRSDAAYFISSGVLRADDLRQLDGEFHVLVKEIAPHALSLVDGFAIPEKLLSPAAGDWVAFNSRI